MMRHRANPDAGRLRDTVPAAVPFAFFSKTGTTKTA
ncbi:MAG: hypothetical protein RLZZ501_2471 [Pseudomonadota bacterium]|jgi:hypothetical protein